MGYEALAWSMIRKYVIQPPVETTLRGCGLWHDIEQIVGLAAHMAKQQALTDNAAANLAVREVGSGLRRMGYVRRKGASHFEPMATWSDDADRVAAADQRQTSGNYRNRNSANNPIPLFYPGRVPHAVELDQPITPVHRQLGWQRQGDGQYACVHCGDRFQTRKQISQHVRQCENVRQCEKRSATRSQ